MPTPGFVIRIPADTTPSATRSKGGETDVMETPHIRIPADMRE
jgi:hypothetical protein